MISSLATTLQNATMPSTLSLEDEESLSRIAKERSSGKKSGWDSDALRNRLKKAMTTASSLKQKAALESEVAKELARKNETLKVVQTEHKHTRTHTLTPTPIHTHAHSPTHRLS